MEAECPHLTRTLSRVLAADAHTAHEVIGTLADLYSAEGLEWTRVDDCLSMIVSGAETYAWGGPHHAVGKSATLDLTSLASPALRFANLVVE
jgi:hypothetical protein